MVGRGSGAAARPIPPRIIGPMAPLPERSRATSGRPVALVTGGARRVGRATALELAAAGFDLVLTFRTSAREAEALCAELRGQGAEATALALDLADPRSVASVVAAVGAGRLDAIVHNASVYRPTPLATLSDADLDEAFRVEVSGPAILTRELAGRLAQSSLPGGGAVVLYSDIHALDRARPGFAAYLVAKAAVKTLAECLAVELAPRVRVHCIAPGVVQWPEGFPEETKARILERTPLGRAGTPEECARLVRFLVAEASYLTGGTIRIDGGRSLR